MAYIVATPPHLKAEQDVTAIMRMVCLALVPAFLWGFYNFGWYAMVVSGLCVVSCMATEWVCQKMRGVESTVGDCSAIVTGLLLAAVLPPNVSWYVAVIGGVFAIGIAKQAFGGLGNNIWNPALLSRAFLQAGFASEINSGHWIRTGADSAAGNFGVSLRGSFEALASHPDAVSGATALNRIGYPLAKAGEAVSSAVKVVGEGANAVYTIPTDWRLVFDSFIGREGGCIAEVSVLALLLGAVYLARKQVITWEIPVPYILTVVLLAWILPAPVKVVVAEGADPVIRYTQWCTGPWLVHLMGGGLIIGAFYMATDMVTSPVTPTGKIIFGVGCGLLTVMIRLYSSAYPEGVCYSIILMNTCVPLIDAWTRPRVFGKKPAPAGG